MKFLACNLLMIFWIMLLTPSKIKADTIDYCNIFRNNVKVHEFNLSENHKYVIKTKEIQPIDTFGIRISTDTPCRNCATKLLVTNLKDSLIFSVNGNKEAEIFKCETYKLLALSNILNTKSFRLYFALAQKKKYLTDLVIDNE